MSKDGLKYALADPNLKKLFGFMDSRFTNCGWNLFGKMRFGYIGWMGFGGSVLQFHEKYRIGFGYAMNLLEPCPWNARGLKLQIVALKCAKKILNQEKGNGNSNL